MRKSPVLRAVALIAMLLLLASACATKTTTAPQASGSGGAIKEGGILRMTGGAMDSLNPNRATASDSWSVFTYIYPLLVVYNDTYDDFEPDFAQSWEVSEDGLTWTFHTVPNAKWSDGEPLTAEDPAFILTLDMLPASGGGGVVKHMVSAEATDPNTLVVTYDTPVGNVLSQLNQVPIVPKHIWEPIAYPGGKPDVTAMRNFQNPAPIVSGRPFMLTEYREDEFARFELNPNWYGQKPHIEGFGMQFYKTADAEINALQNDEVDLVTVVEPASVEPLKTMSNVTVVQSQGAEFHDLIFNSNPKKTTDKEIQDPQLRLALEYATDRQRMIDVAQMGFAQLGSSIVPPVTGKWFDAELPVVPYDLDKANQVLDDAGYEMGPDGVRVAKNGDPLSYVLYIQQGQPGAMRVFDILKEDWAKIGVEITPNVMPYNQLWDLNQSPFDPKTGDPLYLDFEIIMWDWVPMQDPDFILSVLQCDQYGIWSDTGYCNPTYDKMYSEQGTTVDPKERKDLVWQMQEMLYEQKPYIVLYYLDVLWAHSNKWEGLVTSPQGAFNCLNRDSLLNAHMVG
jgi:peptide/nickel transport system substrate-binding protein